MENAITYIKSVKGNVDVLDMCTGSGCIIISLAASGHTSENGAVAIDISDDALKVDDYNKKYNNADYI